MSGARWHARVHGVGVVPARGATRVPERYIVRWNRYAGVHEKVPNKQSQPGSCGLPRRPKTSTPKMFSMGGGASSARVADVESPAASSSSMFTSLRGGSSSQLAAGDPGNSTSMLPSWLGSGEAEEEDPCSYFALTYRQRMMGFAICFSLGTIISIMSAFLVLNPAKFALPYSIGNILSILSMGFLVGPSRAARYMCAPIRRVAACIYFGAIIATLISALVLQKKLLTALFVVVQFAAYLWFIASYIPYGRTLLAKCCASIMGQAQAQVMSVAS